jgi:ABC-type multidrug transport system fused ATPase/permease subunit
LENFDPKFKVSAREEFASNIKGIGLVLRSSPMFVALNLGISLVIGLTPPLIVGATGRFLSATELISQGAVDLGWAQAKGSLWAIAGAIVASQVFGPLQGAVQFGLQRRFRLYLTLRLMKAVGDLPGMAYFEDPKFRDKLTISEWIGWSPAQSVQSLQAATQSIISIAGFVVVASEYAGWVAPAILCSAIPAGLISIRYTKQVGLARWRHSPEMRRADYYRDLGLKLENAKEVRIFGLKDWMVGRNVGHYFASMGEAWKIRKQGLAIQLGLRAPAVAVMAYAYMRMVNDGTVGAIDVGLFAAASMAAVSLGSMVIALFQTLTWLRQSNYYLPVAFQIMNLAREPRLDVSGTVSTKDIEHSGITFENVSFSYPGNDRKVLNGLNLHIPAGQKLALVGENGAGKTTLIKLLCRMYDPTEGRILVDGYDIRELQLLELRNRLAVIFQDFVKYKLSAEDNIGFGSVANAKNRQLLETAASRVGVLEKIEELPDGWDTKLAREFDGVDLSGGEWQRVALARAITAQLGQDSDILILDEPTASLDVRLEHELYEHFEHISGDSTTLLVSHRFSTVRMAERIVFMTDGAVVEDGTHEELMANPAAYAELYEFQAEHYRTTGVLE